jgi:hypothetical protein
MTDSQEPRNQRVSPQKIVSLKEEGYYSNCTMVESTPFDIAILFGKIRPKTDERGQASIVEVYEKQIYLSHLQARSLFEALGKSLGAAVRPPTSKSAATESQKQTETPKPAGS